MPAVSLSVVIITFNEEANIGRCLAALAGVAEEVVVVDSFSTDRTAEICRQHGARVVQHAFAGYVEQKNFATAQATYDHVLQLDADEVLTDELRRSIRQAKQNWQAAGYTLARLTNYCGSWVRHGGWYPDRKLRLYDRRLGRWQGLLLHEQYGLLPGQTAAALAGDLLHYSYPSVEQHVRQLNRFTSLAAERASVARQNPRHAVSPAAEAVVAVRARLLLPARFPRWLRGAEHRADFGRGRLFEVRQAAHPRRGSSPALARG